MFAQIFGSFVGSFLCQPRLPVPADDASLLAQILIAIVDQWFIIAVGGVFVAYYFVASFYRQVRPSLPTLPGGAHSHQAFQSAREIKRLGALFFLVLALANADAVGLQTTSFARGCTLTFPNHWRGTSFQYLPLTSLLFFCS